MNIQNLYGEKQTELELSIWFFKRRNKKKDFISLKKYLIRSAKKKQK